MSTAPRRRAAWHTDAALLFTVLIWGVNFPVLKAALAVLHPHIMNGLRFTVSAVVLGVLYARRRPLGAPALRTLFRERWPALIALGLLGYVVYQLAFIFGIDRTTAASAALIMASSPTWTAVIGHLRGSERLNAGSWAGLALSFLGTVIVVLSGEGTVDFTSRTFVGNLIMLTAAALWGAYTALSKPVLRTLTPTTLAFTGLLIGLPILYAFTIPHLPSVSWSDLTPAVWVAVVYSGALSTGLALVIWNTGVQRVGASQTAIYGNLVPFVAVLVAVVALGEPIVAGQLLGGVLIIVGLVVMRRAR